MATNIPHNNQLLKSNQYPIHVSENISIKLHVLWPKTVITTKQLFQPQIYLLCQGETEHYGNFIHNYQFYATQFVFIAFCEGEALGSDQYSPLKTNEKRQHKTITSYSVLNILSACSFM